MTNGDNVVSEAVNRLAEFQNEQSFATTANSTPLPGPLRNAFKAKQTIQIDKYSIRPVVDRDLEFLQQLDHPLHRHFEKQSADVMGEIIRGRPAWDLCFLFTHPFQEVKALFKSGGPEAVKQAAETEFEEFDLAGLISIVMAVMKQMEVYWEPVIGHKSPDDTDGSKKNTLADGTDKVVTDLVSSLKNGAS